MLYKGKWAVITGASSGIGSAFAHKLAGLGANIILVARSGQKLEALSQLLEKSYAVHTHSIILDLADRQAPETLYQAVKKLEAKVDILVNNAGVGVYGKLHETDLKDNERMLLLNILSLASLTQLFIADMVKTQEGMIFNIASTAAFQPLPYMANYAASKAFVLSFSEALSGEYKRQGIHVLAVCPGATQTAFFDAMQTEKPSLAMDSAETVVDQALNAMNKGKSHVICGHWSNYALAQLNRITPRWLTVFISERVMRKTFTPKIKNA